jgi:glutamate/tyrosine decarboxylase-like PLP-dependent enzyme
MAGALRDEPAVAVLGPVELNQFMVRFGADAPPSEGDRLTLATIARVQEDGVAFMGPAQWRGAWVMRVSVSSMETTEADGDESVASVLKAWRTVR